MILPRSGHSHWPVPARQGPGNISQGNTPSPSTIDDVTWLSTSRHSSASHAALIALLLGIAFTQGAILNSDMAHELSLATQILHGNTAGAWHHSHFPLLPSVVLLPAALIGEILGRGLGTLAAALEFVVLGSAMVWMGVTWGALLTPGRTGAWRARLIFVAFVATPLWVYVLKVPMDVVIGTALCLLAVLAIERNQVALGGAALGLVLLSRDQLIPVALVGVGVMAVRYLWLRQWRSSVVVIGPALTALGAMALINNARFGSPTNFGPGYQSSFGVNIKVLAELLFSFRSGLVFFMPLAIFGAFFLWRNLHPAHRPTVSVILAGALSITIFLTAFLIHPNQNPDLLQQWIGWGGGCRFLIPAIPLVLFAMPPLRGRVVTSLASLAVAVGTFFSGSMLFVAYDAQERIAPVAGNHPPSPFRQWELVPTIFHNTWELVAHGVVNFHSSAYYLPLWQIEVARLHGRVTLLATVPATLLLLGLAGYLIRPLREAPAVPAIVVTTDVAP